VTTLSETPHLLNSEGEGGSSVLFFVLHLKLQYKMDRSKSVRKKVYGNETAQLIVAPNLIFECEDVVAKIF
jgi:hypothetical protein